MRKRKLLLLMAGFLVMYLPHKLLAQATANTFAPVPSASGGNISVTNNFYEGSANISIPFYSATIEGIPINVTGLYNTKGIKVDRIASTIGLGFELYSGNSITRTLKGKPDELFIPNIMVINGNQIDYKFTKNAGYWYNSIAAPTDPWDMDNEMDEFALDLNGRQIKFVFGKDGSILTIPQSSVKIERIIDGNVVTGSLQPPQDASEIVTLSGFKVTDEQANVYYFGKGQTNRYYLNYFNWTSIANINDFTLTYYGSKYVPMPETWRIDSILTYTGKKIAYSYQERTESMVLSKSQMVLEPGVNSVQATMIGNETENKFEGTMSYISKITMPDETEISFTNTPRFDVDNGLCVTAITVTSGYKTASTVNLPGTSNMQQFNFNYAYFKTPSYVDSTGDDYPFGGTCNYPYPLTGLRLKLLSISQVDKNNNSLPYYSFEYIGNYSPQRLSNAQDYFGFYNGKFTTPVNLGGTSKFYAIAEHKFPNNSTGVIYGTQKVNDPTLAQTFLLRKITNSLGGTTEYTCNTAPGGFWNQSINEVLPGNIVVPLAVNNAADGVVISQVKNYDGFNHENDLVTTYDYWPDQNLVPEKFMSCQPATYGLYLCDGNGGYVGFTAFHNNYLAAGLPVNGSNHGYLSVKEIKNRTVNGSLVPIGSTQYYFTGASANLSNLNIISSANPTNSNVLAPNNVNNDTSFFQYSTYPPFTNKQYFRSWAMGLPTKEISFDANGRKVSETEYKYDVIDFYNSTNNYRCIGYLPLKYQCNVSGNPATWYSDVYYPLSGLAKLRETVSKTFVADTVALVTSSYNEYDGKNNLKKTRYRTSTGDSTEKRLFYNYDWQNVSTISPALTDLNQKSVQSVVYSENWRTDGGTNKITEAEANGYTLINNIVRPNNVYSLTTVNGVSEASYGTGTSAINMSAAAQGSSLNFYKLTSEALNYDSYGNAREFRTNGKYTVKLYDGKKQHLICVVSNARLYEIAYTSFDGDYNFNGLPDDSKGNWNFNDGNITLASQANQVTLSGKYIYQMPANSSNATITSTTALTSGKKYTISFWVQGGCPIVKQAGVGIPVSIQDNARGNWTQYSAEFVSNGGQVTLQSTTTLSYIDELRLYPSNSEMNTFTYEPLFGISSKCDPNNHFVFYDYDGFGRQVVLYDHYGNVLSKTQFVQLGND